MTIHIQPYGPNAQEWMRRAAMAINASVKRGERFYGASDNDWIEASSSGFWHVVYNNQSCLQVNDSQVAVNGVELLATGPVKLTGLGNYASDAAAASDGVGVGELYLNSGAVRARVT